MNDIEWQTCKETAAGMSRYTMQAKSLESDARYQLTEARIVLRRRSVIPLMVGPTVTALLDMQARAACETSMLKGKLTSSPLCRWNTILLGCGC